MKRKIIVFAVLILLLLASVLLSLTMGSAEINLFAALTHKSGYETDSVILYSLRLPRLFAAMLAGVGLSLSGLLLQNVMGNPLASPNTIGVNAGAGLAVIVTLWLFPSASACLPFAAFLGAFLTSIFIMILSRSLGRGKGTVILAGIACTTLFQAGISFVSSVEPDVIASYTGFSIGSFVGVKSSSLPIPFILVACSLLLSVLLSHRITALSLGDEIASSLGVRVVPLRLIVLLLASLSASSVISYAGLLGFVGLVVPHIAKKLIGGSLKWQIAASSLCGALLVVLSDLMGRTLFSPSEISVGVVMAFVGAPFFFVLILKRREQYAEN